MKMRRVYKNLVWLLLIAFVMAPTAVSADSYSCTASIPVSVKTTGDSIPQGTQFEVEISAADENSILPETVKVTAGSNQSFSFGPMTYKTPGDYRYIVNEIQGSQQYVTYDQNKYTVVVRVVNDGKGGLAAAEWIEKDGQDSKPTTVEFVNNYQAPAAATPTPTPTASTISATTVAAESSAVTVKTGDTSDISLQLALMAVSGAVILGALILTGRSRKKSGN